MSAAKSGSPPCGIYITITDIHDIEKAIRNIRQIMYVVNQGTKYEKNMHVVELALGEKLPPHFADFVDLLKQKGFVPLLSGKIDKSNLHGADGVCVSTPEDVEIMRECVGEDGIVALECGSDKAKAQQAITADIDLCKLAAQPDLILWWIKQSEVLCCAYGAGIDPENCDALALAGASFVDVSDYVLADPQTVGQKTINVLSALEDASDAQGALN